MAKQLKTVDWKNVAERLVKTFVQSFAAVILATNQPLSKAAVIAAFAAGISAVWNTAKELDLAI